MAEEVHSCVKPAKGPVAAIAERDSEPSGKKSDQEVNAMQARVGKPAPDFEANAYVDGTFKNIKLSDYKGKWISLCFYPGDFTFV